jgi:hypothetical protein
MSDHVRVTRPRGRPKRTPEEKSTQDQLTRLYNRVEPYLDADHRKYLKGVITGRVSIDALRESELLLRYLSVLVTESIGWALDEGKVTADLAKVIGEYRMGIKDLEDMKRRREEQKIKHGTDERMVDPISDAQKRLRESLVGQYTS